MNVRIDPAALTGKTPASADTFRYQVIMMSPSMADAHLKNCDDGDFSGKVFKDKVARYTLVMKEKRWSLNGDTVVIGRSGKVLDGRARLKACVESGEEFPVILVTGVEDEAYISIDTHSRRSAADVLSIDNVDHARTIASAWQAVASYLNTADKTLWRYHGASSIGTAEIALLHGAFREAMADSAAYVHSLKLGKAFPATVATACHYLASQCDREEANEFFKQYAESTAEDEDGVAFLRRRLEALENTTFTYRMALFSKAWRSFMTDTKVSYEEIDFHGRAERKGNLGNEAFPAIFGVSDDTRLDFSGLAAPVARTGKSKGYSLKAYAGVRVEEVTFDRDRAREFLERNGPQGKNRKIRERHAQDLSRAMETGQWMRNGKTVKRTAGGYLADGQHRMRAVELSGASVRMLVVEGLDPSTFATLDLGERKSLGAKLSAGGSANGKQVNSVCTTLWRLARNRVGGEPTAMEAKAIYEAEKEAIDASIVFVKRCKNMKAKMDISIAGALHKLFAEIDRAKADAFISVLASGIELKGNEPVYLLRETIKADKVHDHATKVRAVIRAWNATVAGRKSRGLDLYAPEAEGGYPAIEGAK